MNNWSIYSLDFFQNKSRNPVVLNLIYVTKFLMRYIVIVKNVWENIPNFLYRPGRIGSSINFLSSKNTHDYHNGAKSFMKEHSFVVNMCFHDIFMNKFTLNVWKLTKNLVKKWCMKINVPFERILHHCTGMRFASFLAGGFITAIAVNPMERKLDKRTSMHCGDGR